MSSPHHALRIICLMACVAILVSLSASTLSRLTTTTWTDDQRVAAERVLEQIGDQAKAVMIEFSERRPKHRLGIRFDQWCDQLDRVCGQYDAIHSGLYWHQELSLAQAEAQRRGVPILSLRLLGRLDEQLSCANSRFFRRVLYVNEALTHRLRHEFVLHWSSERQVPKMTIDFGAGEARLVTTVTGNSIHYILNHDGRVVNALPGLVAPQAFAAFLTEASGRVYGDDPLATWQVEAKPVALNPVEGLGSGLQRADRAQLDTFSKCAVEMVPQAAIAAMNDIPDRPQPEWIARNPPSVQQLFDDRSRALIRDDLRAMARQYDRLVDLDRELERFAERVVSDTVHNCYQLRPRLSEWLRALEQPPTLEAFNRRVYTELFHTPADDRWLGLMDLGYTGLSANRPW